MYKMTATSCAARLAGLPDGVIGCGVKPGAFIDGALEVAGDASVGDIAATAPAEVGSKCAEIGATVGVAVEVVVVTVVVVAVAVVVVFVCVVVVVPPRRH